MVSVLIYRISVVNHYYYEEGIQFCGQFVDGEDSSYEVPSKKEMSCDEISQVMPVNLIQFISPLYDDLCDTDEEEEQ